MSKPTIRAAWPTPRRRRSCRNLRVQPRKLNLVAGLIRNLPAQQAVATLTFSKRRIAQQVKKALESAIANAENNHQLDVDRLVVSRAEVGRSIVMRRFHARGRGRAARVEKWFSHLKIVVAERAQESNGRRPHRWVTRSIRSGCGSASTAPGTAAGSPATTIPSCCTRT